ncbi:MAG: two-component regulator propeller domain-containing protein [Candidatus Omnitrophota bacterium]|nr:two-component regulator propeller domain-containing protein [Candidatus Omnitrophota bacterium]
MLSSFVIFNFTAYGFCDDDWELISGLFGSGLNEVCADNKGTIYAAGEKALYRTEDGGNIWAVVFSTQAKDDRINFVRALEQAIFVCTKNGVFVSDDGKTGWKNIFKGIGSKENNVSHIAFSKNKRICLATGAGLLISSDNGPGWTKDDIGGMGLNLKWVEFLDDAIFVAAEKGVYENSGTGWRRTFVTNREGVEYDADVTDESLKAAKPVNSIAVYLDKIFLAADSGVFISEDKGETWKRFIDAGLMSLGVKRILFEDVLYAITDKGVFVFSDKDRLWHGLYKGLATKQINSIAIDSNGNAWIATRKGLYRKVRGRLTAL